jgi:hypothetical protein
MGFIYAIASGDSIKIGYSANPMRRLAKIASDTPQACTFIGCVQGSPTDEARLHEQLAPHCLRGEWFADNAFVRDAITEFKPIPAAPADGCHPLRVWRRRRLMSQRDVAKLTGTSLANISRYEAGLREPPFAFIESVERTTCREVTVQSFFDFWKSRRTAA